MSWRPDRVTGLRIAGVAVVYLATALLGLSASSTAGAVTLIWAPAGIGLAAVLRWGPWMAVGAALGNLAASFMSGSPPLFASFAAAAAVMEALGGAWLLRRAGFRSFDTVRDVVSFIALAVMLSTAASGALGASGLALAGMLEWASWPVAWLNWSIGDAMGVLIVGPLLICWPGLAGLRVVTAGRGAELVALLGGITLLCLLVFPDSGLGSTAYPIAFLLVPPILWMGARFRPCGASVATLLVSGFALWSVLAEEGPFVTGSRDESIRVMWAFIAVTAGSALAIAAAVVARERSELGLRENQSWLHLIESSIDAGTWLWDSQTGEIQGSEHQLRLHGFEPGQVRMNVSNVMASVAREDRERLWETIGAAVVAREAFELDVRMERADGGTRWHALKGRCIPKDPGWPEGPYQLVGITLDVTTRKQLEDALRRGERLAALGTFAAGLAHEINNPVGTILLAAEAARSAQSAGDAAAVTIALDDIMDDARRTAGIVRRVLQFARSEDSARDVNELSLLVEDAAALVRPYANQHGVSIQVDRMEQALRVSGTAVELEQVFVNLLRNAVEACGAGGRVRLTLRAVDLEAHVVVHDDGCGIPEELLARVFDPFFTTRQVRGGTGLGLSICHSIVAALAGRIGFASEPGVGTTVTVSFPLRDEHQTTPPATAPTGS